MPKVKAPRRHRRAAALTWLLVCALTAVMTTTSTANAQQALTSDPDSLAPAPLAPVPRPRSFEDYVGGRFQEAIEGVDDGAVSELASDTPGGWLAPERLTASLQIVFLLTVLSLAPAILMMTTSFVRILVVFGLLRQALGTQQLPPSQVLTSLAMFLTLLVMAPVWQEVYEDSIGPYTDGQISYQQAWERGRIPIVEFMGRQIDEAKNTEDVWMLYRYHAEQTGLDTEQQPSHYDEIPLSVLLPAYMLSELKTAFVIGFSIYLPFLVLDIVVASVTISMGMLMLPPVMISLPFKLMLFVLVDGWHLVVMMLLHSFGST